jgi:hypothetical protein
MAAIIDTRRGLRKKILKGHTLGTFEQSLVEIGIVVFEVNIFLKCYHSFHCLIQNMECGGICDHQINFL